MTTAVASILRLLGEEGANASYGEDVSQLDHALQRAELAAAAGAEDALVAAALLHDIGHLLLVPGGDRDVAPREDDNHEKRGAALLAELFGPEVSEPVRLHVEAKRYLCATQPGYREALSEASLHSLALQGGEMGKSEAARFLQLPHAANAVRLRRFDEGAKVPGKACRPLSHWEPLLEGLLRR